jgi:hypothetical protein
MAHGEDLLHRDRVTVAGQSFFERQAGLEVVTAGQQSSGRFVVECRPRG